MLLSCPLMIGMNAKAATGSTIMMPVAYENQTAGRMPK